MVQASEPLSASVPSHVPGAKFFRMLEQRLEPLKHVPAHGSRTLHLYPLVMTLVLSFYDPMVRSLRAIEARTSGGPMTDQAAGRMARSTTSDALRAFDPDLLVGVINDLQKQVPGLHRADPKLNTILKKIYAADGSYFSTLGNVAWALLHTKTDGRKQGQVRLNFQLRVDDWTPAALSISGGEEGDLSEPDALTKDMHSGVLYVLDRNFIDFDLIKAMAQHDNDFVLRVKQKTPAYKVIKDLPLTAADVAAGVVADQIVQLTSYKAPKTHLRRVQVRHASKPDETVNLLSSLIDPAIEAHVIGEVYRQRWQIELFFRWLKLWCNFDHLLSTSRRGITTQFYVIVIATLAMHVHFDKRVNKYTLLALRQIALGLATEEQMRGFLARRDRERELEHARRARKAAAKNV
jgi:hypothetical protein